MYIHFWKWIDIIWNPVLLLVYGGTYRYVPVRTSMYSSIVHTGTYFWKISHGCTYWYVLVQTNDQNYVPVRTSTYFWQYKAVHGSTRQFMEVQGSTWLYIFSYVLIPCGTYWYVWVQTSWLTSWILRLKFRPAESADFADSADRYTNACTNRIIHSPSLPAALAPFAGLAEAGCSAAAGGSGAVDPSAPAGGSAPDGEESGRALWRKGIRWSWAGDVCRHREPCYLVESVREWQQTGPPWRWCWRCRLHKGEIGFITVQPFCVQKSSDFWSTVLWNCAAVKEKYIGGVYGFSTVWHHTVFGWLIDSIRLSSKQQIIQIKRIRVLRTMHGAAVYIHFLKSCWSNWVDQLMLPISASNGWMDWQKYPKNRKWIRIQQSKALGCNLPPKHVLSFQGWEFKTWSALLEFVLPLQVGFFSAKGFKLHLTQEQDVTSPQ